METGLQSHRIFWLPKASVMGYTVPCLAKRPAREVPEWSSGAVSKTVVRLRTQEFRSLSLRQSLRCF